MWNCYTDTINPYMDQNAFADAFILQYLPAYAGYETTGCELGSLIAGHLDGGTPYFDKFEDNIAFIKNHQECVSHTLDRWAFTSIPINPFYNLEDFVNHMIMDMVMQRVAESRFVDENWSRDLVVGDYVEARVCSDLKIRRENVIRQAMIAEAQQNAQETPESFDKTVDEFISRRLDDLEGAYIAVPTLKDALMHPLNNGQPLFAKEKDNADFIWDHYDEAAAAYDRWKLFSGDFFSPVGMPHLYVRAMVENEVESRIADSMFAPEKNKDIEATLTPDVIHYMKKALVKQPVEVKEKKKEAGLGR